MTLNNAFCTEKNIFLIEKNPAASEEQRKKAQELRKRNAADLQRFLAQIENSISSSTQEAVVKSISSDSAVKAVLNIRDMISSGLAHASNEITLDEETIDTLRDSIADLNREYL